MTVRSRTAVAALAGLTAGAVALTGCSAGQGAAPGPGDRIKVVASTSVWGSVAQAVGGGAVEVESVISDPGADPHSYESSPQDAAKISDAHLVVLNGGGYDEFMTHVLEQSPKPTVQAAAAEQPPAEPADEHAAEGSGEHAGHDHSVNEHVWYDLHVVHEVADKVAAELSRLQPAKAQEFERNAAAFEQQITGLQGRVDQIAAAQQGKPVVVTEPIAHYLIESATLHDVTPPEFVKAVEAENDPPAAAVAAVQNLINARQAEAVIYNPQTESPVTRNVRTAADAAQIPVVELTETLPPGTDYVKWMDSQITALQGALTR